MMNKSARAIDALVFDFLISSRCPVIDLLIFMRQFFYIEYSYVCTRNVFVSFVFIFLPVTMYRIKIHVVRGSFQVDTQTHGYYYDILPSLTVSVVRFKCHWNSIPISNHTSSHFVMTCLMFITHRS